MATDLEHQLRTLGRALDAQTTPVNVHEVTRLSVDGEDSSVIGADGMVRDESRRSVRRRALLAAVAVLVMAMIGSFVVLGRSSNPSDTAVSDIDRSPSSTLVESESTVPPSSATTSAVPESRVVEATIIPARTSWQRPDLFPIVQGPDVADAFGLYSADAPEAPRVSALIGRVDGDGVSDGVRIDVRTETTGELLGGDPQVVEMDGTTAEVYADGDTSTVVLRGDPSITLTGQDPVAFLRAAGVDVVSFEASNPLGTVTINEAVLPDGYEIIVEPHSEPVDALSAVTATSRADSDGPAVTVSVANPLASFAARDVVERTDVSGIAAWAALTPGGYTIIWPVSDRTWAQARVRGGPDETLSLADSVEFAAGIDFVDETQWRATYQVVEPSFEPTEPIITIDKGGSDGVEVGMLVESNGAPIGRVSDVTDLFSNVLLVSSPDFSVDAVVAGTAPSDMDAECRVRGGNDHVGYVCDRPFTDQERVGAEIVAASDSLMIVDGTSFGTITSIVDINGETVALLDLLSEFPVAGDTASVIVPS